MSEENESESEAEVVESPAEVDAPEVVQAADGAQDPDLALQAALAEAADWKNRAYRATADLDNARRRHAREREEVRKYGIEGLLKDLLAVVDNLERALGASKDRDDPLAKGVELVLRQFLSKVQMFGAEPFNALGEPFDPQLHEAMSEIVTTQFPPGTVAQVFQRGWMLHDRLVRPAMVLIARAPEAPAGGTSGAEPGSDDAEAIESDASGGHTEA